MTITVESTGVADGQPIAGEYAVHTPARRAIGVRWRRSKPAPRVVGRARGHALVRALGRRSRRPRRPHADGRRGALARRRRAACGLRALAGRRHPRRRPRAPGGRRRRGFVAHGRPSDPPVPGAVTGQNGYRGLFEGNADLEGTYGGWDGPFPPWNDELVHHYVTTVSALDVASVGLARLHPRGLPRRDRGARPRRGTDRPHLHVEPEPALRR